jgi:cytoskeletal protein CcmA (bactofilin family)
MKKNSTNLLKKEGPMFGKDEKEIATEVMGYIGKGMTVDGKMNFEGIVRVDGNFKGEISANGTLHVGEGAIVDAQMNVDKAIICGEVRGAVNAANRVELKAPGKVLGDIRTPTLIVSEGVIFEGNCVMTKKEKSAETLNEKPTKPMAVQETTLVTSGNEPGGKGTGMRDV